MADADIIPIGSGGRPGRGSGRRTTPSSAARALAGPEAAKDRAERAKSRAAKADATKLAAAESNAAADVSQLDAVELGKSKVKKSRARVDEARVRSGEGDAGPDRSGASRTGNSSGDRASAGEEQSARRIGNGSGDLDQRGVASAGDGRRARRIGGRLRDQDQVGAGSAGEERSARRIGSPGGQAQFGSASAGEERRARRIGGRLRDQDRVGAGSAGEEQSARRIGNSPGDQDQGGVASAGDEKFAGDFDGASGVEVGEGGALRDFAAFEKMVRDTLGVDGERKVAEFLAFVRRRLTGEYEVDEFGYDSDLTDQVLLTGLRPLAEKWFRVEVRGIENIPETGSALIVANHSGTMPIDGLITQLIIADHTNRPLRTLAADLVFKTPFVGELARKGGATLASNDDAERLLRQGNLVGVWPEGFKGLGKPFSERYRLQRFGRGGFVSAAMRTGVPIVPCSIVGAEEIYPLVGNMASLARLVGVPYIPVTPFFPLLGPLGMIPLPSKWLIEFGEPIRTDDFAEGAADDPMLVFNVTDQVRETIQQTLYTLLMQRRSVFF